MNLRIHHKTCYRYSVPVNFGHHWLLLRPRQYHDLHVQKFSLNISPKHTLQWRRDLQENNIGILELTQPSTELLIDMECFVEVAKDNPFNFILVPEASEFPFRYDQEVSLELHGLTRPIYSGDIERLREWLLPLWRPGKHCETISLLQDINKAIYREIKYQRRESKGVQTPAQTLERKKGACRDFATLFMEVCRLLGLAARFVSGYMYSEDIDGRMSMHGWAEVYLPGAGWVGFDPSWGILTTSYYIPVAVSRHPEHVPPICGSYFGFSTDFIRTDIDLFVECVGEKSSKGEMVSKEPGTQSISKPY